MTTLIKNLFFPIPDNHSSTLHGYGVEESYQMGTLSMIPTMNPIPPTRPGGRTMGQKMADETLEELEESLDYLECTKKCRKKRHGATRTPMELARLQDTAHGAHHDLLYKGTSARGGSLHGGLLHSQQHYREQERQRAFQRGRDRGRQEGMHRGRGQGRNEEKSRQKAAQLQSGQRGAHTRTMRDRLRRADPYMNEADIKVLRGEELEEAVRHAEGGKRARDEGDMAARDATAHSEGKGTSAGGTFSGDPDNRRPPGGSDGHSHSAPRRDFVDGDE